MMRLLLLLLLSMSFAYSLMPHPNFPKSVSLDGAWQYHLNHEPQSKEYQYEFDGSEKSMNLPKNWYKEGINHAGIIWFQKEFDADILVEGKQQILHFESVDYLCDVWLNGIYIGAHKGYFQNFEFDITHALKEGRNILKVKVNSPLENYPDHGSLHKTLLRGVYAHHDTRPGGAWESEGQDKNSGGILGSVSIKAHHDYKLEKIRLTPTLRENSVSLEMEVVLKLLEDKLFSFSKNVDVFVTPYNFKGKSFKQTFSLNSNEKTTFSMDLEGARRWQTHDRGFPSLYVVTFKVAGFEHSIVTGFKSLTQNADKVRFLNNKPFFIKGTNYISSQYVTEMTKEKFRKDLELMKKAHINAIRVHAHIEPEIFYELCDEMGFLVWQDYNLQWGYIETPSFQDEAEKQLLEMIDKLYNHPSIYIWSMHNEPPWNAPWMKYKDYNPEQNKAFDERLYQSALKHDPYHLVQKLSSADEHPWFGWYSNKYQKFAENSKSMLITEYGAQAIPHIQSVKKFIPDKYLHPKYPAAKKHWEYHNFQFNWSKKQGVEFKTTLKTFIKDSQTYQADLLKFATEMLRIQKYEHTASIFQFMFNEGWESMNWGIVDYWRVPKAGYYALQKAYAPIIIVAKQLPNNFLEFYVVNDTVAEFHDLTAVIEINGKSFNFPLNLEKDSVRKFANFSLTSESKVVLKLKNGEKLIASNSYDFSLLEEKEKK
ncbi:MAG TPA: hypothetical protein EYG94_03700 [Campylobacterales bacterium]|nr:hypothetical protein [Sulfurimonas sp.]HIP51171.1 hypothetical protein [Campylobacterales bacterium]